MKTDRWKKNLFHSTRQMHGKHANLFGPVVRQFDQRHRSHRWFRQAANPFGNGRVSFYRAKGTVEKGRSIGIDWQVNIEHPDEQGKKRRHWRFIYNTSQVPETNWYQPTTKNATKHRQIIKMKKSLLFVHDSMERTIVRSLRYWQVLDFWQFHNVHDRWKGSHSKFAHFVALMVRDFIDWNIICVNSRLYRRFRWI